MPRGAFPVSRSDLAASEPYRSGAGTESYVPSGQFPSPNHELAAGQPYRADGVAPDSFISWPIGIDDWGGVKASNSSWAEEAFAKACAEPKVFIPADVVLSTAQKCGSSNFAEFMQTHGFRFDGHAYLDGPFHSLDWTNAATVNSAISNSGPVKIGVASANLAFGSQGQVTPGTSGWAIYGLAPGQPEDTCASLCGYGPLAVLVDLFERNGAKVDVPSGMPAGHCYALFTRASIGIIDQKSLTNIAGEAWVRNPTTIVKNLSA